MVRSRLHRAGARYRVDHPISDGLPRPVKPDVAFTRLRVAVFVDGCFWHGCPEHGRREGGKNEGYWSAKIARNAERDQEQRARLEAAGWTVLRFWEHEDPDVVVENILKTIGRARG